jgi:hypothetical protein
VAACVGGGGGGCDLVATWSFGFGRFAAFAFAFAPASAVGDSDCPGLFNDCIFPDVGAPPPPPPAAAAAPELKASQTEIHLSVASTSSVMGCSLAFPAATSRLRSRRSETNSSIICRQLCHEKLRLICRFRLTPTQYQKRVGLSWKMLWYSRQQLTRMRTSLSWSLRPRRFVRGEPRAEEAGVPCAGVPCAGIPWACGV